MCARVESDEENIDEPARTFGERFKEHLKIPSPIYDHHTITGHPATVDSFSIVDREDQNLTRSIKESIYVRVDDVSLNWNKGKHHLLHILMKVCLTSSELKLN